MILKKMLVFTVMFSVVAAFCTTASAVLLHSQMYDATMNGSYSNDLGADHQMLADDFILANDSVITGMTWWGYYGTDLDPAMASMDFRIVLYNSLLSPYVPATSFSNQILSASVSDTGINSLLGTNIYRFSVNSLSIPVNGSEAYWLSISEADDSTPRLGDTQWLWSRSSTSGDHVFFQTRSESWQPSRGDFAFELHGSTEVVPEPTTILLFGTGLVGLAGLRIRKKQA